MNSPPLEGQAILVSDGKIADIIPISQVPDDADIRRYPDGIAFPAFINMHTHLMWSGFRGIGDNKTLLEWIYDSLMSTFFTLSQEQIIESIKLGIKRSYRAGITTVLDCHFDSLIFETAKEEGLRGIYFQEAFGIYDKPKNEIKRVKDTLAKVMKNATSDFRVGFSPHAPYTVTPPILKELLPYARKHGLPLMSHLAETSDETEYFRSNTGPMAERLAQFPDKPDLDPAYPLEYFEKYGVIGPDILLVHCVNLEQREIERIAERGAKVVTCPTSNAKLGCGIAPVEKMFAAGIDVYLGTDSEASCDEFNMFEEMRRLLLMQRALTHDITGLNGRRALEMCTLKAAECAGFNDIGALETGKTADLIVVTPETEGVSPNRDPYERVVWGSHNCDIDLVLSRGVVVHEKDTSNVS